MNSTYYLVFKAIHLLGVIVFLGNIIVTGWWKLMADRTGNPVIIAFAQKQVTNSDWIFTLSGVTLALVGGLGNVVINDMPILSTSWLLWGMGLFAASGVIWIVALIPLQISLERIARDFTNGGDIPERYWFYERLWMILGVIATILPLANIYWMVFKIS